MKSLRQPMEEPCGLTFGELAKLSDEEVMAHIQAGHDDAMAVLFDRYHRLVLSIAARILRDMGEAEDVTQAIFLEVFKVAAQFDAARGSTKAWLLQYAYHRSMSRRRYLKRRKFYEANNKEGDDADPGERAATPGPPNRLTPPEVRNVVRKGLAALNHSQRRTLEMAYFEGMSLKEIADRTGESIGNVRHHYYRGLRRLRSLLFEGKKQGEGKGKTEFVRGGVADVEA